MAHGAVTYMHIVYITNENATRGTASSLVYAAMTAQQGEGDGE